MQKLTTSAMKSFKSCRKKYFFEYIEQIKPVSTPKPLEIGTLYHEGLEYLLNADKNLALSTSYAITTGEILSSSDIVNVICEIIEEKQKDKCVKEGLDFDLLNVKIAGAMIRHFSEQIDMRQYTIKSIEYQFEVPVGYAKRLIGKIDGVIEFDGKTYLMENKTTAKYGEKYLENLQYDEQATNYLFAYNKLVDEKIVRGKKAEGVFYFICEKPSFKPFTATPEELKKYTKDGRLYANQHESDETAEEYAARCVSYYSETKRVHTIFIYRTPQELQEQVNDINLVAKDIAACEREETYYRNPLNCLILQCPFRPKCLEDNPETDVLFVKKSQQNEELSYVETGCEESSGTGN